MPVLRKERKKAQKEARKKELARQQEEERQLAILEDAKEEEEKIRKGEARLDSSLAVVLRVTAGDLHAVYGGGSGILFFSSDHEKRFISLRISRS